ncbi:hypothetical protein D3C87_2053840 [compost metagenome]
MSMGTINRLRASMLAISAAASHDWLTSAATFTLKRRRIEICSRNVMVVAGKSLITSSTR